MKHLSTKSKLLFLLMALFMGVNSAWADAYTTGFETADGWAGDKNNDLALKTLAEGWDYKGGYSDFSLYSAYKAAGAYSLYGNSTSIYLITPKLAAGTISWKEMRRGSSSKNAQIEMYKATKNGDHDYTIGTSLYTLSGKTADASFTDRSFNLDEDSYIAILLKYACVDVFSAANGLASDGPAGLCVYSDSEATTKVKDGVNLNFGLVSTAGSQTYYIKNESGADWTNLAVAHTGNAVLSSVPASLAADGITALTITQAATGTTSDVVTITAGEDLEFTINVSGTIKEAGKMDYDFATTLPTNDGWTIGSNWSIADGVATIGYTEDYMYSPQIKSTGEKIYFKHKKTSSSSWYGKLLVSWATTGNDASADWTDIDLSSQLTYNEWKDAEVTIPSAAKFIRIKGQYVDIDDFYGLEVSTAPLLTLSQSSFDFGLIDANTTSEVITISNTGKSALTGLNFVSSNPLFTVNCEASSIAAETGTATFTVTMSSSTPGAQTATITIKSDNADDLTFTATGAVAKAGTITETFDSGLPTGWTNSSSPVWSFSEGVAYAGSGSWSTYATLTTPKLTVAADDFLAIKAKAAVSSYGYLKIYTSTDGSTFGSTAFKEISYSELSTSDYKTVIVSGLTSDIKAFKFEGYYVYVDEIAGFTYAPVLSVTKDAVAVNSPDAYAFGECGANASVTYSFANTGAGTINITNVAITGTDASVYSTNWTESVAAPFDLVITQNYDADKAGAKEAVVTVTTTEGAFVINLTGTLLAANAPELAVSTSALDFGKVTADAVETVTVTNNGTGSMTVNITSNSEDFEVSTASLTEIGAGESKNFTVTFKYGSPYGVKNGIITITPTYDETALQTITVTGKAKDPDVWSEDFSGNTVPTGWDAGANWTIADGVAKASWTSSATYLTTPTLTVNSTGDEMTFDYAATGNYVSISIQKSKDGGAWETCSTTTVIGTLNNGDTGSATITGLEAGDYQFRFKNDDYNLDNFEGFKLNLADHIATISAYTIPTSSSYSMTMKEGQNFDATVTVKESRGVAEDLTAKLYMGTEVIGIATGTVAANGTETLTITCTPTTSAVSGVEMHIEVEWAGETLTTEEVTRYVAALTYLTLDEESSDAITAGTYDNVTLKRKFAAGWNTVCLPFTVSDVEGFFGAGAKAYNFSAYSAGMLTFSAVNELTASYPYIVYVPAAITEDFDLNDITIASGDASPWYRYQSGAYFRGTYAPIAANGWTKNNDADIVYGLTSEAKIAKLGASATSNGFRAYFDLPEAASTARIAFFDESTGITKIVGMDELNMNGQVYNLNGQKVHNAQKGLYIINGKKVIVK